MSIKLTVNAEAEAAVYQALTEACVQDDRVLTIGEEKLKAWEIESGFYSILYNIFSNQDIPVDVRCLAAVLFKNGSEKYWRKDAPNGISEDEKSVLRGALLSCICEPADLVFKQIVAIISKAARLDCPQEWPDLVEVLMSMVHSENHFARKKVTYVLYFVVKALLSKRFSGDRMWLNEVTNTLYPVILDLWNTSIVTLLNMQPQESDVGDLSNIAEISLMSGKLLLKLTVYGLVKPHESSYVHLFLNSIFERIKPLLQYGMSIDAISGLLLQRHVSNLIKTLACLLERHPYSFKDYMKYTFESVYYYGFTTEGTSLVSEKMIVQWFNLLKNVLTCPEYKFPKGRRVLAYTGSTEVKQLKTTECKQFFTESVLRDIFVKLIEEYFVLDQNYLADWDADPENFACEEKEHWKYDITASSEALFLSLLHECNEIMRPMVISTLNNHMIVSHVESIQEILKRDALYKMMGLAVYDLFDEVDFDSWFSNILIHELEIKDPNYRILRRRIVWLLGIWAIVGLSNRLRPTLYSELIKLLQPCEDMAVKITTSNAYRKIIGDDFSFQTELFKEFVSAAFEMLLLLLWEARECSTKLSVLNTISCIIEKLGSDVAPALKRLVESFPVMWDESLYHNMLRCAIMSTLVRIVKALKCQSEELSFLVVPIMEYSLDTKDERCVHFQEDGLLLLQSYVQYLKVDNGVTQLFKCFIPLLESSTDHVKLILDITQSFIVLSPDEFLQNYGNSLVNKCMDLDTFVTESNRCPVLKIYDLCLSVRPEISVQLLRIPLQRILWSMADAGGRPMVLALHYSVVSKFIVQSIELFAKVLSILASDTYQTVDVLFKLIMENWLQSLPVVWLEDKGKIVFLAFSILLTSKSNVIMELFSKIMHAICVILIDFVITEETNNSFIDSLFGGTKLEYESDDERTETDLLRIKLLSYGPVYTIDSLPFLQKQLEIMQKQVGIDNFNCLIASLDPQDLEMLTNYGVLPTQ